MTLTIESYSVVFADYIIEHTCAWALICIALCLSVHPPVCPMSLDQNSRLENYSYLRKYLQVTCLPVRHCKLPVCKLYVCKSLAGVLTSTSSCIFEPTCAFCTVGSYAPLSVCPSVRPSVCMDLTKNQTGQ